MVFAQKSFNISSASLSDVYSGHSNIEDDYGLSRSMSVLNTVPTGFPVEGHAALLADTYDEWDRSVSSYEDSDTDVPVTSLDISFRGGNDTHQPSGLGCSKIYDLGAEAEDVDGAIVGKVIFLDGSGTMTDRPINIGSFGFTNSSDTTDSVDADTVSQVALTGGSSITTNDPMDLTGFGIDDFMNGAESVDAANCGQEVCLDESESIDVAMQEVCLDESESIDVAMQEACLDESESTEFAGQEVCLDESKGTDSTNQEACLNESKNTDSAGCGQEARLDSLADGIMNLDGFGIAYIPDERIRGVPDITDPEEEHDVS